MDGDHHTIPTRNPHMELDEIVGYDITGPEEYACSVICFIMFYSLTTSVV
jgi:hypothetical protein